MNFSRLLDLKKKIDANQATSSEKKEYMELLYVNGNITKDQYEAYITNRNADDILKASLTIGGLVLLGWLVSKIFK